MSRLKTPLSYVLAATVAFAARSAVAEERATTTTEKVAAASHPLEDAIRIAEQSRNELEKVEDYIATFHKKERVGEKLFAHRMLIKNRKKPFSVYLRFVGEHDGREVIYVEGANKGNLLVHETGIAGLVGTIPLLPTSPEALSESSHPITSIGMWNLLDRVIKQWKDELAFSEVQVKFFPNAKLGNNDSKTGPTECRAIESTHTERRREFKYYRTRLFIDKKTTLPVRVEQYAFPREPGDEPLLAGEYQYTDIRLNQNLQDADFDPHNPKYNY